MQYVSFKNYVINNYSLKYNIDSVHRMLTLARQGWMNGWLYNGNLMRVALKSY